MFLAHLICALVPLCLYGVEGALFQSPADLPANKSYDYIIVGGGAGGGVLAHRLTEDTDFSVLLLEAGSSDFGNLNIEVPGLQSRLLGSSFDWNFTTTNMPGLNGRAISYPRGFVLGGSTAINNMAFNRGSTDDFDRWADFTGDEGWSWKSLFPYMLKMENLTAPTDHRDTNGEIISSIHGHHGPLSTSLPSLRLLTDERILNASTELASEYPYNIDMNSGDTIGISWAPYTIANGARASSASAYISPALSRENLDVLVNTLVTRVVQTGAEDGTPVFRGVEFTQNASSSTFTLNATREVVLSAGAVKTPQILMLSGIGDSTQLSSVGIQTIVNLPDIGQNLIDHPLLGSSWTVSSTDTLDNLQLNATFFNESLDLWQTNRTGELVLSGANQKGWLRLQDDDPAFENGTVGDSSAGPTSGHYEFIFSDWLRYASGTRPNGHFFSVTTNVVSPSSVGNITLNSSSPFDAPLINPNLLASRFDILTMVSAIKSARRFMSAPSWNGWIVEEYGEFAEAMSDAEIEEYARNNSATVFHPCCTAAMGPGAPGGDRTNGTETERRSERGGGVLKSDLTVKGTVGLRVVDASAFPFIPCVHTQGPTYILAERAADLIKATMKNGTT